MKHVLYITNDGLTDPLGRSQILPYLCQLRSEYKITIISCEKSENYEKFSEDVLKIIEKYKFGWVKLPYRNKPPIISALRYMNSMFQEAIKLYKSDPFQMVHCRNNLTSMVGYKLQQKLGIRFLFDMRSFYPDERVDGGLWPQTSLLYRIIYRYFKKREKQLMRDADAVVVLTHAAKNEILSWQLENVTPEKINVIPCCSDLDHFNYEKYDNNEIENLKKSLNLHTASLVISYLGTIGTWYMLREMMLFYKELKKTESRAKFLFITCEGHDEIKRTAHEFDLDMNDIVIQCSSREKVPKYILLSHFSLFFILPKFSKKGSSPTKHGELMGMGLPVIANAGVGDTDEIILNTKSGYVLKDFDTKSMQEAIRKIPELLKIDKKLIRAGAFQYFSLDEGVKSYRRIYEKLTS